MPFVDLCKAFAAVTVLCSPPTPFLRAAEQVTPPAADAQVASGFDIHAQVAAHRGRPIHIPAGDHVIDREILLAEDHAGLHGPGRIIMTDASRPIIVVRGARGVTVKGVTLTRPEGHTDAKQPALVLDGAEDATIEGVTIIDNRSAAGVIYLERCRHTRVLNCSVLNYMTVTVDDRTKGPNYGIAFNAVDGTGIMVKESVGTLIGGNSIIEKNILPTEEMRNRHQLGKIVKRAPQRGALVSESVWKAGYLSSNWMQGAAIQVTSPYETKFTRVSDNYIENPALGLDLHSDHAIVSGNMIVNPAQTGIKACHGSRNVVIANNQIVRASLMAIRVSPAAASSAPVPPTATEGGRPANTDGGHILANNIICDFGYGDSWWIWEKSGILPVGPTPISIGVGQLPDDPPVRDVLVTGNMVYDPGSDGELRDGGIIYPQPRYNYAVYLEDKDVKSDGGPLRAPVNVRFSGNMLQPGKQGGQQRPLALSLFPGPPICP